MSESGTQEKRKKKDRVTPYANNPAKLVKEWCRLGFLWRQSALRVGYDDYARGVAFGYYERASELKHALRRSVFENACDGRARSIEVVYGDVLTVDISLFIGIEPRRDTFEAVVWGPDLDKALFRRRCASIKEAADVLHAWCKAQRKEAA